MHLQARRPTPCTSAPPPIVRALIACLAAVPVVLLLLPVMALVVVAQGFVACVRAVARLAEPHHVPWKELIEFDPDLGWKPRPDLDTWYMADFDDVHRIVTDAEGWPGRRSIDESRLIAIGDSFAFGYGVDTSRSFAAAIRDTSVKAVGAPGYSMVQGVLLMEQLSTRLAGKLVVWLVYLENDLQDNLSPDMRGYRAPYARYDRGVGRWTITRDHIHATPWAVSDLDRRRLFPRLCVPGPLADRAYDASRYLIGRAAAACRAAGAELTIITIPHPMQLTSDGADELARLSGRPDVCDPSFPDQQLETMCRAQGVPVIAGMSVLSIADYKHREGIHWNERGHRRMAQLLRLLQRANAKESAGGGAQRAAQARVPASDVRGPHAATVNQG